MQKTWEAERLRLEETAVAAQKRLLEAENAIEARVADVKSTASGAYNMLEQELVEVSAERSRLLHSLNFSSTSCSVELTRLFLLLDDII